VQHRISGPAATKLLELCTPTDIASLKPNHSTLSCFLHPHTGGIVDDTVIARLGPEDFYIVTNAACRIKDLEYLTAQIAGLNADSSELEWKILDGQGLLALQGPLAAQILQELLHDTTTADLMKLYFGQCIHASVKLPSSSSESLLISRAGYTGEDGFEISIPANLTVEVAEALFSIAGPDKLRWAGLGARDSLRLEAGMCLYGHDLDDSTTPAEAGLGWVVSKQRRIGGGFHGAEIILPQLKLKKDGGTGVTRRRVGLLVSGAPAREGAEILDESEQVIGRVTSGCPSPTMGKNIAMGYIKDGMHKAGTEVNVKVRGKTRKATVTKMPFVETRYWREGATGTAPG
jgi:aminomethyltransferase